MVQGGDGGGTMPGVLSVVGNSEEQVIGGGGENLSERVSFFGAATSR
jgi:hypothetical protein